jgi:hypothetical protein
MPCEPTPVRRQQVTLNITGSATKLATLNITALAPSNWSRRSVGRGTCRPAIEPRCAGKKKGRGMAQRSLDVIEAINSTDERSSRCQSPIPSSISILPLPRPFWTPSIPRRCG